MRKIIQFYNTVLIQSLATAQIVGLSSSKKLKVTLSLEMFRTRNKMRVAIESSKGMKVNVAKLC